MAINKKILVKLKEQTTESPEIRSFIHELFQFESAPKNGWFGKEYCDLLEKYCKE